MFSNRQFWDDLAIQSYKTILKKQPNCAIVHNNLGLAYVRIGRLNKAVRSFQRAIKVDKEFTQAYYHLGTTFQQMGKQTEALRAFSNYAKRSGEVEDGKSIVPDLIKKLKKEKKAAK